MSRSSYKLDRTITIVYKKTYGDAYYSTKLNLLAFSWRRVVSVCGGDSAVVVEMVANLLWVSF